MVKLEFGREQERRNFYSEVHQQQVDREYGGCEMAMGGDGASSAWTTAAASGCASTSVWLLQLQELPQCGSCCYTSGDTSFQPRPHHCPCSSPNALPRLLCRGIFIYIYVCASERFREQLIYVLFEVHLKRWRRPKIIINQVAPDT